MADHDYEGHTQAEVGDLFHVGASYGVVDVAVSKFDDVGNLIAYTYSQITPEEAIALAANIAKASMAATNFHAEVVAQLRADQNGHNDDDGDA